MNNGSNSKCVSVMHRVVPHDAFRSVALKGVLIELFFASECFRAAVAFKNTIGWDVVPVVLQVCLNLDWLHEELPASTHLADELGLSL